MTDVLTAPRVAYLALGSNLGDRSANIEQAIDRLDAHLQIEVTRRASLLATAPMYVEAQPEFLNTCVCVETTLAPVALLEVCLEIERAMGRVRVLDKGPRNIDVDIVLFADMVIDDPRLTVPHPAMLERDFVLMPLAEIAAEVVHPLTGRTILEESHRGDHHAPHQPVDDERDVPKQ